MRLILVPMAGWLAACGPSVPSSDGSGSSGATSTASDGSSGQGDTEQGVGSTSFGIRYDLAPFEPVDVCGFARVTECDRTWPAEDDLGSGWGEYVVPGTDSVRVSYADDRSLDAFEILSVAFDLPCASSPGVPTVPTARYTLDAEITQWTFGGFEWSQQSTYPGRIDVELLSECLHLRVHDVEVTDDQPLDGSGALFEWSELLRTGYVHAPW